MCTLHNSGRWLQRTFILVHLLALFQNLCGHADGKNPRKRQRQGEMNERRHCCHTILRNKYEAQYECQMLIRNYASCWCQQCVRARCWWHQKKYELTKDSSDAVANEYLTLVSIFENVSCLDNEAIRSPFRSITKTTHRMEMLRCVASHTWLTDNIYADMTISWTQNLRAAQFYIIENFVFFILQSTYFQIINPGYRLRLCRASLTYWEFRFFIRIFT